MKIFISTLQLISAFMLGLVIISCEDFVEIDPPDSDITTEVVFSKDETALAAVDGMYHQLYNHYFSNGSMYGSVTYMGALSADEIRLGTSSTSLILFEENNLIPESSGVSNIWTTAYNIIYHANALLKGLETSSGLSTSTLAEMEGAAKFIRAFTHFYLVNLYGEVPLVTGTDYNANALATQTSIDRVYEQVIQDLEDAYQLVSEEYRTPYRTNANRSVVAAFLARVYLYRGDWENARLMADEVIGQTETYELLDDLNSVFLKESRETIFGIAPVGNFNHTYEGNYFILTGNPGYFSPCVMTDTLLTAFEEGDSRYDNWVASYEGTSETYYYPYKYKISYSYNGSVVEHSTVIRLAEMYLIRAEARIHQNDIEGGIEDLNVLRERADLTALPTNVTQEEALLFVEQERRIELFTEWAHRWLDLKRTDRAGEVLGPVKPGWQSTDVFYPIPQAEREKDPNLGQNDGY